MRKVLFVTLALVLLLGTFGTASAQDVGDYDLAVLGEVWSYNYGGFLPGEPVDVYLWAPSTLLGWPLAEGPYAGTWFMPIGESEVRRQSYPAYQAADEYGFYFAEFMFPRDEVWYPCSYPYKWNCNYVVSVFPDIVIEFHSPVWQDDFEFGLAWPYFDSIYYAATDDFLGAWALANPMDTVAPMYAVTEGAVSGYYIMEPYEVMGYFWKVSDLEDDFEFIPVP
jgi:hypothetical protein